MDIERARREHLRWEILSAVQQRRPEGINESILASALRGEFNLQGSELRCELDYLSDKELLTIADQRATSWLVSLTPYGIDVLDYCAPAPVGVRRPEKDNNMELATLYELRWRILKTLFIGRLRGVNEKVIVQVVLDLSIASGGNQVRRELCYLEAKDLVRVDRKNVQSWVADLTAYGVDVVEGAKKTPRGVERMEEA